MADASRRPQTRPWQRCVLRRCRIPCCSGPVFRLSKPRHVDPPWDRSGAKPPQCAGGRRYLGNYGWSAPPSVFRHHKRSPSPSSKTGAAFAPNYRAAPYCRDIENLPSRAACGHPNQGIFDQFSGLSDQSTRATSYSSNSHPKIPWHLICRVPWLVLIILLFIPRSATTPHSTPVLSFNPHGTPLSQNQEKVPPMETACNASLSTATSRCLLLPMWLSTDAE